MNWQTIAVLAVVVAAIAAIAVLYVCRRKKGGSSCGCGCAECAMRDCCRYAHGTSGTNDASEENDAADKCTRYKR